jgi:hypothetical protein
MPTEVRLREERVNLWTALIALVVSAVGTVLLWVASLDGVWSQYPVAQVWLSQVAALLFVTGLISLFWELRGKRVFLDEVLAKAQLAREVRTAGIRNVVANFLGSELEWDSLFRGTRELDVFFAYGSTWRRSHIHQLRELAARPKARIRIVLPDVDNEITMAELSRRFAITPDELQRRIGDAEAEFRTLAASLGAGATIMIARFAHSPVYTFYRFDEVIVLSMYQHGTVRGAVPAFVVERGGTLFDFVTRDFDEMVKDSGTAKNIFDSNYVGGTR